MLHKICMKELQMKQTHLRDSNETNLLRKKYTKQDRCSDRNHVFKVIYFVVMFCNCLINWQVMEWIVQGARSYHTSYIHFSTPYKSLCFCSHTMRIQSYLNKSLFYSFAFTTHLCWILRTTTPNHFRIKLSIALRPGIRPSTLCMALYAYSVTFKWMVSLVLGVTSLSPKSCIWSVI